MVGFLETCSALIVANLNSLLIGDKSGHLEGNEPEAVGRMGAAIHDDSHGVGGDFRSRSELGNEETATRIRIEKARKRFLRTEGHDEDISLAGREAGWVDESGFQQAFLDCVGESPAEHWKKITELWSEFSRNLTDSGQRLVRNGP
jgi:AraC-like DNA-binding protein